MADYEIDEVIEVEIEDVDVVELKVLDIEDNLTLIYKLGKIEGEQ